MMFPKDPKEGQTFQEPALTHPQRHAVKEACNKLRAAGLEFQARMLDMELAEPPVWTFSRGAWSVPGQTLKIGEPLKAKEAKPKKPAAA